MRRHVHRAFCFAIALAASLIVSTVDAKTLRWSSKGDASTMDPHGQDESFTNAMNNLVYERLFQPGREMADMPWLAASTKQISPLKRTVTLREGIRWHDGTPLTADDVVFSFERAARSRQYKTYAAAAGTIRKVDNRTVEFTTAKPSPTILSNIGLIPIMSRAWAEKNKVANAQDFTTKEITFAARNAMGTGPYKLVSYEPGVRTVHARNAGWWGWQHAKELRIDTNLERIEYRPITSDVTRMAALKSGELDFVIDPAPQDIGRLRSDRDLKVWQGDETRIIMFAMDQARDELLFADVKGKNPFKDRRVRQALYQAIDAEAIKTQVMRGLATPTAIPFPNPKGEGLPASLDKRLPFDIAAARKLLTDAGYPNGFGFTLHCPNDRYVNDEKICVAVASMWARIGLNVKVDAMPKAQYFARTPKQEFSVCMQGWGDNNRDAMFTLKPLFHSKDGSGAGDTNYGNFRNPELDKLIAAAETDMDAMRRQQTINQAVELIQREVHIIPLHRQVIPWLSRANVELVHRSDNKFAPLWIKVK
jgi:peptide/nickel transport system substrate-binding protein